MQLLRCSSSLDIEEKNTQPMQLLRCSSSLDIEEKNTAIGEKTLEIAIDILLLNVAYNLSPNPFPNTPIWSPLLINLSPIIPTSSSQPHTLLAELQL
jgi:hypothetical protein